MDIVTYLLPITGEILLQDLIELKQVNIKAALLPETFRSECATIIQMLNENNTPYKFPSNLADDNFLEWFCQYDYDIGISIGYDKKLPGRMIDYPEKGTLNIHPALLPEYRGANPYFWVIRNKEKHTGSTLHKMDEQFDTGPILKQKEIEIPEDVTMGELFISLNQLGSNMAISLLKDLLEGKEMPAGRPQSGTDTDDLPLAPRVIDRHLRIDWSEKYEDIDALVRAANPFFGAYCTFGGRRLEIYEIQKSDHREEKRPGAITTSDRGPLVRCCDCWVNLKVVRVRHFYEASGLEFQRREKTNLEILNRVV
jgi:methionyl-tRNA formyltransferase